jgi:hypothetical protein
VDEDAVAEQALAVDEHVPDRPVAPPQTRAVALDRLVAGEARQDVVGRRRLDQEPGEAVADDLVRCVTGQGQPCPVDPQDATVGRDPEQPDRRLVEEDAEILVALWCARLRKCRQALLSAPFSCAGPPGWRRP